MKTAWILVSAFAIVPLFASKAQAAGGDGCYQTFAPGSLNVVVCVKGSNEEGIGGSGATVALVSPNGGGLAFCAKTTAIADTGASRTYRFNPSTGMKSIRFSNAKIESGREEGEVTFSETDSEAKLSYIELGQNEKARLGDPFEGCEN